MVDGIVHDATAALVGGARGRDRTDRPTRRSTQAEILFEQYGPCARLSRFDGGRQASPAAADDDHVKGLLAHDA
jgi:hypothetical protein